MVRWLNVLLLGVLTAASATADAPPASKAPSLPPLPKAVSSLGAVLCDGHLYVYGGHAGKTHTYDTRGVLGAFHRLKLDGGTKWEDLPGGPILQGMNLAAHGGKVCRVGGMQPRNAPGEPEGRSSHDVVVAGDKLVVGGWRMCGRGEKSMWHDTALILDVKAAVSKWEAVAQPFKRRALTAVGSLVYVLGGLGTERTNGRVEVLDVESRKWSLGPDLPGASGGAMAFSPALGTVGDRVVVNTSAGPVYRMTADGTAWEKVGEAARARVVARLVPLGPTTVALVGGAARRGGSGNVAEVEVLKLAAEGERASAGR